MYLRSGRKGVRLPPLPLSNISCSFAPIPSNAGLEGGSQGSTIPPFLFRLADFPGFQPIPHSIAMPNWETGMCSYSIMSLVGEFINVLLERIVFHRPTPCRANGDHINHGSLRAITLLRTSKECTYSMLVFGFFWPVLSGDRWLSGPAGASSIISTRARLRTCRPSTCGPEFICLWSRGHLHSHQRQSRPCHREEHTSCHWPLPIAYGRALASRGFGEQE